MDVFPYNAADGGHVKVTDVILKTKGTGTDEPAEGSGYTDGFGAFSKGSNSVIELENTTISDTKIGLTAQDGGAISMTGGIITASKAGALFESSNSDKNKLENITISSGKDGALLISGIDADKSTVTLKNVKVTQAQHAIIADHDSTIKVSGGSFEAEGDTIQAISGSNIVLTDVKQITSSDSNGLAATSNSTIVMTDGTVTGKKTALAAADGGHIKVTDVALKTVGVDALTEGAGIIYGFGAFANGNNSVIELLGKTTISDGIIGLEAKDGGAISMAVGTITASKAGAVFFNSKSDKNKLENVTISSAKDDALLIYGIDADKNSTVTLKNVTVTQANSAIVAENSSTVTVYGGSFDAKDSTIVALNGGSVILTDNTQIMSSEDDGLYAHDNGTISMTGGTIKASYNGAGFVSSESDKNKLENVTISSAKDNELLQYGIKADKSTVVLNNVEVTQAAASIVANDHSTITVSGGSFSGRDVGGSAEASSTIILKNNANITSSDGEGLLADGSGSKIIMMGGSVAANETALFAINGGHIDATDVALTTEGKGGGAFVSGDDSTIQLHGDTIINNTLSGLDAVNGGKIISENLSIIGGEAIDQGPDNERTGVWTSDSGSEVRLMGKTTIQNVDEGFYADGGSKIISGDLIITGGESKTMTVGVNVAESDSAIELNGKTIIQNFDVGLTAGNNSTIKMTNGYIRAAQNAIKNKINAKKVALWAAFNGHIDVQNASLTAGVSGLQFIALYNIKSDVLQKYQSNEINLTNADVHAENGTGIFVGGFTNTNMEDIPTLSIGTVNLKNSEIHADVLLGDGLFEDPKSWKNDNYWDSKDVKAISNGTFTLSADQSTLEGRANIAKDRNVHFDLKNKTTWTLKTSTKEKDDDGQLIDIAQRSRSDISTLNLDNSSIIFNGPTEEHYHTLHIGSGKPDMQEVYNATGDAKIYFNIAWSDGVASADQKTDKLLIHGDVSGSTTVYIKSDSGNNDSVVNAADPSNIGGLSLIQVSGKAEENSFKLANGYTTRDRLPYKYTLTAYGPESSHGQADIAQSLFDERMKISGISAYTKKFLKLVLALVQVWLLLYHKQQAIWLCQMLSSTVD